MYPDIIFDGVWFHLIVEIDEHQHRGADYKCDERRMYDIIAKLGMPCVFIRYNPDNKKSNSKYLLERVNYYFELKKDLESKPIVFDDYGFKVEYLFYEK